VAPRNGTTAPDQPTAIGADQRIGAVARATPQGGVAIRSHGTAASDTFNHRTSATIMNTQFHTALSLTLIAIFNTMPARAEHFTEGKRVQATTRALKAGDFVWEPERSEAGPVLIVVSKPEQTLFVYRNGIRIARSSVSTGRPGHPTPVGVFHIMEKEKDHVSTIYKGAEMPWMERLTWTGIALHAGDLPGYPDSHGCVRLPLEFSKLLFTVTASGGTVIIADDTSSPRETVHPGLIFSDVTPTAGETALPKGEVSWTPEKSPTGAVAILASSANKQVYVYRNGVEIGRAGFSAALKGMHVYSALATTDAEGHRKWVRVDGAPESKDPNFGEMAAGAGIPADFIANVRGVLKPGSTIVLTDQPVNGDTQSKPNFKVLGLGEIAAR